MEEENKKNSDINILGETNFRNHKVQFGIKREDRRRHTYIIGKTGMGKTTLMENMVISDILNGNGVGVVDPHGEFAEKMVKFIPEERLQDLIYFNPGDINYPIAFNILENVDPNSRHLIVDGIAGLFKKIWADSWGPRLEYVLRNSILALMEYPDSTLLGIPRLFVDKEYRLKVTENITDPIVRSFWQNEYAKYPDKFQTEAVAPIQNKVGQFLSSSLIRNIVGQTKTSFNIRDIMDKKKILIMNLSKGRIGEGNSMLLGAMMVTKMQLAAMERIDIPEDAREDFYLYVDEFQNFATDSFANILSEARKYRLNLILAHQYVDQLSDVVRQAIFGNVGTLIAFRVGAIDAEFLEKEFLPEFTGHDLMNLAKYNVYLKLMINGVASSAFSASTLSPYVEHKENFSDLLVNLSRQKYSVPKKIVDKRIIHWSGFEMNTEGKLNKLESSKENAPKASMRDANKNFQPNWQDKKEKQNINDGDLKKAILNALNKDREKDPKQ